MLQHLLGWPWKLERTAPATAPGRVYFRHLKEELDNRVLIRWTSISSLVPLSSYIIFAKATTITKCRSRMEWNMQQTFKGARDSWSLCLLYSAITCMKGWSTNEVGSCRAASRWSSWQVQYETYFAYRLIARCFRAYPTNQPFHLQTITVERTKGKSNVSETEGGAVLLSANANIASKKRIGRDFDCDDTIVGNVQDRAHQAEKGKYRRMISAKLTRNAHVQESSASLARVQRDSL